MPFDRSTRVPAVIAWIGLHACNGSNHSDGAVPFFAQPLHTLTEAQHDELCAALVGEDERQGASREELCVVLANRRENCSADALNRCKDEIEIVHTRDCPYDRAAEPLCEASAADVASCLLERLESLEFARPLACESFEPPDDPPICTEIQEACPYLLFPSYKVAHWD